MKKFQCTHSCSLLDSLIEAFPDTSKSNLRSWIKHERVVVGGKTVKIPTYTVKVGDQIQINEKRQRISKGIEVLYQDRDIVVIEKPAKLLSVASETEHEHTAHGALKKMFYPNTVHIVHRLDEDTSGIMMFALNERARDSLKKTFEIHDIKRKYAAIIEGNLKEPSGTWTSYLYEDPRLVMHSTYDTQKGRRAVTHFQVEKQGRHFCQLTLTLETGRKNQIRVHCADAGHPVVGDKKYGSKSNPIKRMALHAYFLEFKHPRTGVVKSFSSTIPTAFLRLVS